MLSPCLNVFDHSYSVNKSSELALPYRIDDLLPIKDLAGVGLAVFIWSVSNIPMQQHFNY